MTYRPSYRSLRYGRMSFSEYAQVQGNDLIGKQIEAIAHQAENQPGGSIERIYWLFNDGTYHEFVRYFPRLD